MRVLLSALLCVLLGFALLTLAVHVGLIPDLRPPVGAFSEYGEVWGGLVSALGAVGAGALAVFAAKIGASALMAQTERMEKATLTAAEHQASAILAQAREQHRTMVSESRKQSEREREARYQQAQQFARALAGEIGALLDIVEHRKMIEVFREQIDLITENPDQAFLPISYPANGEYLTVYRSAPELIGLLPGDLPERISSLYTLVVSIIDTLRTGERSVERYELFIEKGNINAAVIRAANEGLIESYQILIADLDMAIAKGRALMHDLNAVDFTLLGGLYIRRPS